MFEMLRNNVNCCVLHFLCDVNHVTIAPWMICKKVLLELFSRFKIDNTFIRVYSISAISISSLCHIWFVQNSCFTNFQHLCLSISIALRNTLNQFSIHFFEIRDLSWIITLPDFAFQNLSENRAFTY